MVFSTNFNEENYKNMHTVVTVPKKSWTQRQNRYYLHILIFIVNMILIVNLISLCFSIWIL